MSNTVRLKSAELRGTYNPLNANNIPTPPIAIAILEPLIQFKGKKIWEPAVGEGFMADALESHGAKVVGTDLRTNTIWPKGKGGYPFESFKKPPGKFDLIITNPPYGNLLRPFLTHALIMSEYAPVWLMMPQHAFMTKWMTALARTHLRGYYPITFGLPYRIERVDSSLQSGRWKNGGAFKHAWSLWYPGEGDPHCRLLEK